MSLLLEQITNHPSWRFFYGPEMPIDLKEDQWKKRAEHAKERLSDFLTPEVLNQDEAKPSLNEVIEIYLKICGWEFKEDLWQHDSHSPLDNIHQAVGQRVEQEWQMRWQKVLASDK